MSFTDRGSAVIDVRSVGGVLSEVGRVVAASYHPVSIDTLSSPITTGFVALHANDQIWFGGGRQDIAIASISSIVSRIDGIAAVIDTIPDTEGWYHAVAVRSPHAGNNFALIGTGSSYEAVAHKPISSLIIDTVHLTDHDNCAQPPDCHGGLALTVFPPGLPGTVEAFSIDRTNGTVEMITSMVAGFDNKLYMPMTSGLDGVLDAASGALVRPAAGYRSARINVGRDPLAG